MNNPTNGSYSYLDQSTANSGFTNNWLTARHNDKLFEQRYGDFPMYDEPRRNNNVFSNPVNDNYRDIFRDIERTPISDMLFSKINIDHIKYLISMLIKHKYGYQITAESQSDDQILIIARSIYLQHCKHLPENVAQQVAELNMKILTWVVPRVASNIQGDLTYQRDHGSQPLPMAHPVNVSSAGTRSNRSVTDTFI